MIKKIALGAGVLAVSVALMGAGCDYQPGSLLRAYCAAADPDTRQALKEEIEQALGAPLPVDACQALGVVDALKAVRDDSGDS